MRQVLCATISRPNCEHPASVGREDRNRVQIQWFRFCSMATRDKNNPPTGYTQVAPFIKKEPTKSLGGLRFRKWFWS